MIDVPGDEAARMVAAGQADLVKGRKTEKAILRGKTERATK